MIIKNINLDNKNIENLEGKIDHNSFLITSANKLIKEIPLPQKLKEYAPTATDLIFPCNYNPIKNELRIITFIELSGHSSFTLLKSMAKIKDISNHVLSGVALTDDNLFGSFEFNQEMFKLGKKGIIGLQLYVDSLPLTFEPKKFTSIQNILDKYNISLDELKRDNPKLIINDSKKLTDILAANTNVKTFKISSPHQFNHLNVLALNETGFSNLSLISSLAQRKVIDREHQTPYLSYDELKNHVSDTVVLTGYQESELYRALCRNQLDLAKKIISTLIKIWGKDNVYLEVQRKQLPDENNINQHIFNLGKEFNLRVIATNDYHMINKNDKEALEILQIDGQSSGSHPLTIHDHHWSTVGNNNYLLTPEEMEDLWKDHPYVLTNTLKIFQRVSSYDLAANKHYFPIYKIPKGFSDQTSYFEYLIKRGINLRFPVGFFKTKSQKKKYLDRLKFEIKSIEDLHYVGYFLIVADFINYAKRNFKLYDAETTSRWKTFIKKHHYSPASITIGPGRGSAAGSLVSYVLFITEIDPIPGNLLFERFLNPDRHDLPDIDSDMPDNKRNEIIDYVSNYYNENDSNPFNTHVAGIITFSKLQPRLALKDVSRVLGKSPKEIDKLVSLLPNDPSINKKDLYQLMEEFPDLKKRYKNEKDIKHIIDIANKLLGCERNASQHACGYVITPEPVRTYMPIAYLYNKSEKKAVLLTGYTHVEERGLLKMDFLGLKSTRTINDAIELINHNYHKDINMSKILKTAPYDLKLYQYIGDGNTEDLFQLSSPGMTELMSMMYEDVSHWDKTRENGEKAFEQLVAGIALYRPGPMDEIPTYLNNLKTGKIKYPIKGSEQILAPTYGVIVYQEQVMELVRKIAGFSAGDADIVRKGMGKKKINIIKEYREYFVNGSKKYDQKLKDSNISKSSKVKNIPGGQALGYSKKELNDLWDEMESFGRYAFNKSHAYSYAYVSITETWLATYYPFEYMTSVLNTRTQADEIKEYINVAKKRHLPIAPPTINASSINFTTDGLEIKFGLSAVKYVNKAAKQIVAEYQHSGKFTSLMNFIYRMSNYNYNGLKKNVLEALIYAGVFDEYSSNRKALIDEVEDLIQFIKVRKLTLDKTSIFNATNTQPLLNLMIKPNLDINDYPIAQKLTLEKEYTGFYITGHPATIFQRKYNILKFLKVIFKDNEEQIIRNHNLHLRHLNLQSLPWNQDKNSSSFRPIKFISTLKSNISKYQKQSKSFKKPFNIKIILTVDDLHVFLIQNKNRDSSQKNLKMASLQLEDDSSQITGIIFPNKYQILSKNLSINKTYLIEGELKEEKTNSQVELIINDMINIESYLKNLQVTTGKPNLIIQVDEKPSKAKVQLDSIIKTSLETEKLLNKINNKDTDELSLGFYMGNNPKIFWKTSKYRNQIKVIQSKKFLAKINKFKPIIKNQEYSLKESLENIENTNLSHEYISYINQHL